LWPHANVRLRPFRNGRSRHSTKGLGAYRMSRGFRSLPVSWITVTARHVGRQDGTVHRRSGFCRRVPPAEVPVEYANRPASRQVLHHKCGADPLNERVTLQLDLVDRKKTGRRTLTGAPPSVRYLPRDYFASEQSHPPAQQQERLQVQASPQPQRSTLVSTHAHDALSHWQDSLLDFSMVSPVSRRAPLPAFTMKTRRLRLHYTLLAV
jgi:hypothetical protein